MPELNEDQEKLIWGDIDESKSFPAERPLLSHYSSVKNIENILNGKELWLSNPLLMNDLEELKFGVLQGAKLFRESQTLRDSCAAHNCYDSLIESFDNHMEKLDNHDAIDIYIFCFSLHDASDNDGLLSMWRGYGSNGGGAAIVFNTAKIDPAEDSPLTIGPVLYATTEERLSWIDNKIEAVSKIISEKSFTSELTAVLAWNFFARLLIYSLHTKHKGFSEEKEWRLTYIGMFDQTESGKTMLSYHISDQGIEPKFKLALSGPSDLTTSNFNLENTIERLILGPTVASPLSKSAFMRMLDSHNMHALKERVFSSTTPYRSS